MDVTRLHCDSCDSTLEGCFEACRFCQLSPEQHVFVAVFLKARGNIKEVERELGISYPTVRSRLDGILEALGYQVETLKSRDDRGFEFQGFLEALGYQPDPAPEEHGRRRRETLDALDRGELTVDEAVRILKQL
jgi:hypothetical protein